MKATEVRARDSYKECVSVIEELIAGEHKHWIPEKWVEDFKFKWSNPRDTYWWYFKDYNLDYLYLDREDWSKVTIQRCYKDFDEDFIYWNVYIEKECESRENFLEWTQALEHKFHWVRSLKHALYLWEVAWDACLGLFQKENYFLTRREYDTKCYWDSDI